MAGYKLQGKNKSGEMVDIPLAAETDKYGNELSTTYLKQAGDAKDTSVSFADITGAAENVTTGDKTSTLWSKVKNWFSRLKSLAFKDKVETNDIADGAVTADKLGDDINLSGDFFEIPISSLSSLSEEEAEYIMNNWDKIKVGNAKVIYNGNSYTVLAVAVTGGPPSHFVLFEYVNMLGSHTMYSIEINTTTGRRRVNRVPERLPDVTPSNDGKILKSAYRGDQYPDFELQEPYEAVGLPNPTTNNGKVVAIEDGQFVAMDIPSGEGVTSVNGRTGDVDVTQEDLGLITGGNFIPAGTRLTFTSKPTVFATNTRINVRFMLSGESDQCTGIEIVSNGQLLAMRAGSPYTIYNPSTGAFNYTDITLTQDYTFESTEIKQWLIAHTDLVVDQYHYVRSINGQTGDVTIEASGSTIIYKGRVAINGSPYDPSTNMMMYVDSGIFSIEPNSIKVGDTIIFTYEGIVYISTVKNIESLSNSSGGYISAQSLYYAQRLANEDGDGRLYQHHLQFHLQDQADGTTLYAYCTILTETAAKFQDTDSVLGWLASKGYDYKHPPRLQASGVLYSEGQVRVITSATVGYNGRNSFLLQYYNSTQQKNMSIANPTLTEDTVL